MVRIWLRSIRAHVPEELGYHPFHHVRPKKDTRRFSLTSVSQARTKPLSWPLVHSSPGLWFTGCSIDSGAISRFLCPLSVSTWGFFQLRLVARTSVYSCSLAITEPHDVKSPSGEHIFVFIFPCFSFLFMYLPSPSWHPFIVSFLFLFWQPSYSVIKSLDLTIHM